MLECECVYWWHIFHSEFSGVVTLPTGLHNVSGDVFALEMTKKVATIVGLAVTDGLSRFRFGTRGLRVIHAAIRPLPAVPLIRKAGLV